MPTTDAERRLVHARLEAQIGAEAADLLMQMLPWQTHDELATRQDLNALTSVLRGEMAELRAELRGEMTELRGELQGEMAELRTELRGEMTELRAELRGEMAELRAQVDLRFATMQRWIAGLMVANGVALVTALVT